MIPWAQQLAIKLFDDDISWPEQKAAWKQIVPLEPLDSALTTVFQQWDLPLSAKLQRTPHRWQPAVLRSCFEGGIIETDDTILAQYTPFADALCHVHTVHFEAAAPFNDTSVATWRAVKRLAGLRTLIVRCAAQPATHHQCQQASAAQERRRTHGLRTCADEESDQHGVRMFAAALAAHTSLTRLHIDMSESHLPEGLLSALGPSLVQLHNLQSLSIAALSHENLIDAMALANSLRWLTQLTALRVSHAPLHRNQAVVRSFWASLAALPGLEDLALDSVSLAGSAGEEFMHTLPALTALTAMDLSRAEMGVERFQETIAKLAMMTHVRKLTLDGAMFESEHFAACVPHAAAWTALQALRCRSRGFAQSAIGAFGTLLQCLSNLTLLDLSNTLVGNNIYGLVPAVGALVQLRSLNVYRAGDFGRDGAAVGRMLECMPRLTYLNLSSCSFGYNDDALEATAAAASLASLGALRSLDIGDSFCGDDFATAFATRMPLLAALTHLCVQPLPAVTVAGRKAMLQGAAALTKLQVLDILNGSVCKDVATVRPLLPHLQAAPCKLQFGCVHGQQDENEAWRMVRDALSERGRFPGSAYCK